MKNISWGFHHLTGMICVLLAAAACAITAPEFLSMSKKEPIYPSPGLTGLTKLSSYFPGLHNSPGNTDVYVFEGEREGGRLLILGGTHPNEPAGFITSVLLVENLGVQKGKVFLIPRANNSGFMHTDPQEGNPQRYPIRTTEGKRWFRYGSRLTNPIHQWPDPVLYVNPSGQTLSGVESRNLNRCYPGRQDGHLTEKVAYAITSLIRKEKIDLAIDLHEAAPEYPVVNAIVFHENSAEVAALASMKLQIEGLEFRLEASPPNLRGLSHREWGDSANTKAILLESANVSHGRLKGKPSASLILEGKDKNYCKAARLGRLFVPFDEKGIPLKQRVSRHLAAVYALLSSLEDIEPNLAIRLDRSPSADQVRKIGIGPFLSPPR